MNLAMKNVRAPTTEANIVTADFFSIIPGQKFIAPYPVMTPSGPKQKEIAFPEGFDVVMGNPPYTRWSSSTLLRTKQLKYEIPRELPPFSPPFVRIHELLHVH